MPPIEMPRNPPEDPIRSHPTRAEQLDILSDLVADRAGEGDRVLDLGIGTGYVARLILDKTPLISLTGIDLKAESLDAARETLAGRVKALDLVEGNLEDLADLDVPAGPYRAIYTVLTFHDLPDEAKIAAIRWSAERLAPGGALFILDRIRLHRPALFPLQIALWNRIERIYGSPMRSAVDFDSYIADMGERNRPARFEDYFAWMEDAGLAPSCLHLHGNIGLFAGMRP
ncbi:MAG: class I SAM-dependent methyltransferase [Proteobacteria bacterium]|nr:class I SAM-dependent methyltransferase [Pseudomonadota bacterium]